MSIVTNPVYQTAVQELETILSPRVVSRSLKEGLLEVGRTAEDIGVDGLETILKSNIYRQLQVTMPVVEAKSAISKIIDRLQTVAGEGDGGAPTAQTPPPPDPTPDLQASATLERQTLAVARLQDALKPYNLYFEWAEVQKLRAQLQLLESEVGQGNDSAALIEEAEAQLDIVSRMLEDHLVIQARELGELREAFEQVRTLGGPKVRRFENLIGQIETAQGQRQLAQAEVERTRKLSRDLRKLMESSVYSEAAVRSDPAEGGVLEVASDEEGLLTIDTENLDPEVSARLLLLDLEGERHELEALAGDHTNLLSFETELAARFEALRAELDGDNSVEERLAELSEDLGSAAVRRREALLTEIEVMESQIEDLRAGLDTSELRQTIQVAKGILSTTLPHLSDIQHVRTLHRRAFEQSDELARLEQEAEGHRLSQLREQAELLARLETTLIDHHDDEGDSDEYVELHRSINHLRSATDEERSAPDLVAEVRRAEQAFETAVAERSDDETVRERTRVRSLIARVERMPGFEALDARIQGTGDELSSQLAGLEHDHIGEEQLGVLEALVASLEAEVKALCVQRLEALAPTVADLGGELLNSLKGASEMLDRGEYPDLIHLEQTIAREREERRGAQRDDLRALEREAKLFDAVDSELNERLKELLTAVHDESDVGRLGEALAQGWRLLERIKEIVDRRLSDFEPRLDAALEAFSAVEMLNSEDVAKARRTLQHLDSQREAMARVSISLRTQLEQGLQEAETLIAKLQEEFEATRAIAGQLVSANVLDDMLNIFGNDPVADQDGTPAPADAGSDDPILSLLIDLTSERGVAGALLMRGDDLLSAGELTIDQEGLMRDLDGLQGRFANLGRELELGDAQRITLESHEHVAIVSWPQPNEALVVVLDDPSVLSLVLHRLRHEEERLRTMLRAP